MLSLKCIVPQITFKSPQEQLALCSNANWIPFCVSIFHYPGPINLHVIRKWYHAISILFYLFRLPSSFVILCLTLKTNHHPHSLSIELFPTINVLMKGKDHRPHLELEEYIFNICICCYFAPGSQGLVKFAGDPEICYSTEFQKYL